MTKKNPRAGAAAPARADHGLARTVAINLQKHRLAAGLTIEQLAAKVGAPIAEIAALEAAEVEIKPEVATTLKTLARVDVASTSVARVDARARLAKNLPALAERLQSIAESVRIALRKPDDDRALVQLAARLSELANRKGEFSDANLVGCLVAINFVRGTAYVDKCGDYCFSDEPQTSGAA